MSATNWLQLIGYSTLGVLFFFIMWGMAENIVKDLFSNKIASRLVAFLMATYGFWYPLWDPLRILYIFILSFAAVVGTALSRLGMLRCTVSHGKNVLSTVALSLLVFDAGTFMITTILQITPSFMLVGYLISWGLLVYGISAEVKTELLVPVISKIGLPHSSCIISAFILASVVFLPVEFPAIDSIMTVIAIFSTLVGWYSFIRHFK